MNLLFSLIYFSRQEAVGHGISNCNIFLILDEGNQALQEFLLSCNPKQQHSTALESYLIKPIQRILKYPLLLTQLKVNWDAMVTEYENGVRLLQSTKLIIGTI